MNSLRLISLLTYTFGVYIFGAFLIQQFRLESAGGRSGAAGLPPRASRWIEAVGWTVLVVCFFWFLLALAIELTVVTAAGLAVYLLYSRLVRLPELPASIGLLRSALRRA